MNNYISDLEEALMRGYINKVIDLESKPKANTTNCTMCGTDKNVFAQGTMSFCAKCYDLWKKQTNEKKKNKGTKQFENDLKFEGTNIEWRIYSYKEIYLVWKHHSMTRMKITIIKNDNIIHDGDMLTLGEIEQKIKTYNNDNSI